MGGGREVGDEIKELAIGEEGVIDGVKVRCVEHSGCGGCAIESGTPTCARQICSCIYRDDHKSVIFQEVK